MAARDAGTPLAYYRVFAPEGATVAQLAAVAGRRWAIERAKGEVGLDEYEMRRWDAWHRHVTFALLADASSVVARMHAVAAEGKGGEAIS